MADGFHFLPRNPFGILIALAVAAPNGTEASNPIVVVTTNTILADMTAEVGGNRVEVYCLIARGVEPHGFEPLPADVARLADAALLIANGAGSEPWLDRLTAASGFYGELIKTTDACDLISRPTGTAGTSVVDPHAWQDPACGIRYVGAIRDALRMIDPEHALVYRERARLYRSQLEVLDSWIRRLLAPLLSEQRRFVTSHDSLAYFARAYRLEIIPIRGLDVGHEPDAAQLARLVDELRSWNAGAIFTDSAGSQKLLEQLARDSNVRLGGYLYSDTLGPLGSPGGTYLGMLRENALTLAESLIRN